MVAGALPVVMYVASKVVASPDWILSVKVLMVALFPSTSCFTFSAAFTTEQPVSPNAPSTRAAAKAET